ncbi:MAG: thioredoxin family protein [Bacteroidia bacterium]
MKTIRNILTIAFLISTIGAAAQTGIRFQKDSFSVLLAKAKQQNKLVFIDCYTSWCGPCKWMEKNVFPNDTVAGFYNTHFVCASFDMEKGEGVSLAKKYDVRCYPTYLFINGNGTLVHRQSSTSPVLQFVELGEFALLPDKQYAAMENKYTAGKITPSELIRFMSMRQATCLAIEDQLEAYMKTQADSTFIYPQNWMVLRTYVQTPDCSMFRYLLSHRAAFETRYTTDSVHMAIIKVYGSAMGKCLYAKVPDTTGYKKLRSEVVNLKLPFTEELILENDMAFYSITERWNEYARTATSYVTSYADSNWATLNNIAWTFYAHIDDPGLLAKALTWSKRSVDLDANDFNLDTYAALLYKLGRKSEAEAAALRAIALADKDKVDSSETKALLEKIRKMK